MIPRVALLLIVFGNPLSAQLRLRPMGQLHLDAMTLSFEASSDDLFSIEGLRSKINSENEFPRNG